MKKTGQSTNTSSARLPQRATWKQKSALAAIAVGLTLLAGEIGLRVVGYDRTYVNPLHSFHEGDPELGFRGRPSFVGRFHRPEFDVLVAHDDRGFRKHETLSPVAADGRRVFVLGDSFTWGWGVAQGEVYTDQLSRALPGCEVVNLGLNASGTTQQLTVFRRHAAPLIKPNDMVVLEFFQNDFFDNVGGWTPMRVADGQVVPGNPPRRMESSFKAWLKDHSRLANLAIYAADVYRLNSRRNEGGLAAGSDVNVVPDDQIKVARHLIGTLQQECSALGASLLVVYVPGQAELGESTSQQDLRARCDAGYRQAFFRCVDGLPLEVVDLLPGFERARAESHERLTFSGDEHWNANGHRVAAELIEKKLR